VFNQNILTDLTFFVFPGGMDGREGCEEIWGYTVRIDLDYRLSFCAPDCYSEPMMNG
jgi:hypothetical protein